MHYALERIDDHGNLEWFERAIIHTNFNTYVLFIRHASVEYEGLTSDERIDLIERIPLLGEGDAILDDFNITKGEVVNAYYNRMLEPDFKEAWRRRSIFLNS